MLGVAGLLTFRMLIELAITGRLRDNGRARMAASFVA
jgi:hypothetical protein